VKFVLSGIKLIVYAVTADLLLPVIDLYSIAGYTPIYQMKERKRSVVEVLPPSFVKTNSIASKEALQMVKHVPHNEGQFSGSQTQILGQHRKAFFPTIVLLAFLCLGGLGFYSVFKGGSVILQIRDCILTFSGQDHHK
jgi:hypothetical protein